MMWSLISLKKEIPLHETGISIIDGVIIGGAWVVVAVMDDVHGMTQC